MSVLGFILMRKCDLLEDESDSPEWNMAACIVKKDETRSSFFPLQRDLDDCDLDDREEVGDEPLQRHHYAVAALEAEEEDEILLT
jgi:hypothetical protein